MDVEGAHRRSWLDRVPSSLFLALLVALVGLAFLLSWIAPDTFWHPNERWEFGDAKCGFGGAAEAPADDGFFFDYYWRPILCDEGYNQYNTATWAVLLGLLLLWAYRFTVELKETVGTTLIFAVVPFLVWGSVYRVLEDADLFAPWSRTPPGPLGDGFLDRYLGVFFITPIIYVEILFIAVGLLLWGHRAKRIAEARGPAYGLRYFAYSLVLLVALYAALWASEPTYIRHVAHPWVALAAASVAFWLVWRITTLRNRFDPHWALGAYGLFFLLIGTFYVVVWMTGGAGTWQPDAVTSLARQYPLEPGDVQPGWSWPVQWWVYVAAVAAPGLIAFATWRYARRFAGLGLSTPPRPKFGGIVTVLVLMLLVAAVAVFLTILGMRELAQRGAADAWDSDTNRYYLAAGLLLAGPVVILFGDAMARWLAAGPLGHHGALLHYATPVNLLMVFGQLTDALMTSLGIDLYHYTEKHVLPRFLIRTVDAWNLPAPFGDYPTAMVMVTLKLFIVLLVVVAIDVSADREMRGRENLVGLVKLGIIMVGLSPGIRDAVRLAMAT